MKSLRRERELAKEMENILKKLIDHGITISFKPHGESLRETTGILRKLSEEIIELEIYATAGERETYYLNRRGSTLHSIIDLGKRDE